MTQPAQLIQLRLETTLRARPAAVFRALTTDIESFWGEPYVGDEARRIELVPELGGRFAMFTDDGGELWGTVVALRKDRLLSLTGNCGMGGAVFGRWTFELEPEGETTKLRLAHDVTGDVSEERAAMWTAGWQDLVDTRLRRFVEDGAVSGIKTGR